jgi:hypothetical protein
VISDSATTTGGGGVGVTGVEPPPPLLQEAIIKENATKTKQIFFIYVQFILKQIYIKSSINNPLS